jgi:site-specific DNA recombinase
MSKEIRAAGCVRVSTPKQVEEGESLEYQRRQIEHFVKEKGWILTKIYEDEGISGASMDRPDFKEMISDAKKGEFDYIIFYKLSRFARNARDFMTQQYELHQYNVQLISIKENIDPTTSTGRLIAGILALFAEFERETIEEQLKTGKNIRWKEGRAFIGQPPYGYKKLYEGNPKVFKGLITDEKEVAVYQRIVSMYIDQNISYKDIAIQLNSEGFKCKRGKFSSTVVGDILKNPAYYGHYVVNKYKYKRLPNGKYRRTKELKPASEWIEVPIEPIISKRHWDQIQKHIKFNKNKSKRSNNTTRLYWLRDVLICGRCDAKVKPRIGSFRKDGTAIRYYSCYWRGTSKKNILVAGRKRCDLPYIKAEVLEALVWQEMMLFFSWKTDRLMKEKFNKIKYEGKNSELKEKILRFKNELKYKKIAQTRLLKLMEDPELDLDELRERLHKNQKEKLE